MHPVSHSVTTKIIEFPTPQPEFVYRRNSNAKWLAGTIKNRIKVAKDGAANMVQHQVSKWKSKRLKKGASAGLANQAWGALDNCVRVVDKAARNVGRHAKSAVYGAALQVVDAGSDVAQGVADAAKVVRKSTKNAGSEAREVARKLSKKAQVSLQHRSGKASDRRESANSVEPDGLVKLDSDAPFGLRLPENFEYNAPHLPASGVPGALKQVEETCRENGNTVSAYHDLYSLALYVGGNSDQFHQMMVNRLETLLSERAERLWMYSQQGQPQRFCGVLSEVHQGVMVWQQEVYFTSNN
ncbi:hypothetical protein [Rhizobacter sp. OV335]|uniref:hypothetical protein n=1 Tax=Rhizobacter sp. OV335 TaxID=1500264 RepID=UPI0009172A0D|nr:hypothetical protein [Rhizobacter sp. OV335]SHM80955.1 hypothetical protein SAMN02787076_02258 [Rhizobacter sp. OV335]